MYILLGDMYGTMFEEGALQAPEVAQAFQRWVCPAIRSPYINWMLHDATVTIQAIRPYGLGMFSGDLLEGSNRVLKDIRSSSCDRVGGAGTLVSRRIKMLRQVNECLFLPACALQGIAARWLSAHYKTIARSIARAMARGLGFVTPCPNKQGKNAYFSKVSDASGTTCDAVNVREDCKHFGPPVWLVPVEERGPFGGPS